MIYRVAADTVLLLHFGFILLVVAGALLVFRYPAFIWVHLPAAAWGAFIELTGRICPLTTLENAFLVRAGLEGYSMSFVERYLWPLIYPAGLTREMQIWLGGFVIAINAILYFLIWLRRRARAAGAQAGAD